MDVFVGQSRRIKWVYDNQRQGVSDLTLTIRDESDAVVFGPVVAQELSGGVYFADWTPTDDGSFTGYFESDTNPVGFGVLDIRATPFYSVNESSTVTPVILDNQISNDLLFEARRNTMEFMGLAQ